MTKTKLKPTTLPVNLTAYQRAVEHAARTVAGIPRQQLEAIVAATITAIGTNPQPDDHTS